MDEADRDMDMAADPFLEAGIDIPKELPYQKKKPTPKLKMKINSRRNSIVDQGVDAVSIGGGSVASVAKATSNTMISISRLQQFRRKLSRSYLKHDGRGAGESGPRDIEVPASRGHADTASMPHGLKIAGQAHVEGDFFYHYMMCFVLPV